MGTNEIQPIRIERIPQPPFIDVPIFDRDRYVDHRFDKIFDGAIHDRKRPPDFHPGWWVIQREYNKQPSRSGILLTELPFRYKNQLDPLTYLSKIVEVRPDPDAFEKFYAAYLIFMSGIWDSFETWKPEPELASAVFQFHNGVITFSASR